MTCRLCNHQFCWLCFQDYEKHNASICSKLTLERKVKKEKLVKISTNYLKKNDLMKSKVDFDNQQKLQSDKILTKLKKQKANQKDNIDFFKTCEEIEEFLFLASKISFVFSTFSEKEELIKKTKASLINSIMRLKITRKKEPMMKSLLIKNLKFYCKIIEMNLNKARNDKDLLENFF